MYVFTLLLFQTIIIFNNFIAFLDLTRNGQVVLAGDPKQLGPVVLSTLSKTCGLEQSMLSRFINYPSYQRDPSMFPEHNGYNPKLITHLIRNYRSLPEIVHIYSKLFYNSLLVATVSVVKTIKQFLYLTFYYIICRKQRIMYWKEYY